MKSEDILKELRKVENPFTNMDIVTEGLVTKVEIDEVENRVRVYVAFARNTPAHPFTMAVNWPLQAKIVREMVKVLEDKVGYLEIVDDTTLQRYYPLEDDLEV
ncbi:iron-sulfur cluster assembly protein [Thermococcus radiotolerans]|nr:iron-sulfur cluster assembly protein [Thermococcus radiotolerans]